MPSMPSTPSIHDVLRVLSARARAGARDDGYRVALAADDRRLAEYQSGSGAPAAVFSIRPPADCPRVSRLATDGPLLRAAFESGRAATHAAFTPSPSSSLASHPSTPFVPFTPPASRCPGHPVITKPS